MEFKPFQMEMSPANQRDLIQIHNIIFLILKLTKETFGSNAPYGR